MGPGSQDVETVGLSGVYSGSLPYFVPVFHLPADTELAVGLQAPGSGCVVGLGELESSSPWAGGWKVSHGRPYTQSPQELSTYHAARVQCVPGST